MFKKVAIAVALTGFSVASQGENFLDKLTSQAPGNMDYKYVTANYVDYDPSFDGFGFSVSYPVKQNIVIQGYYDTTSRSSVDLTVLGADALIHQDLPSIEDTDVFYGAGFRRYSASVGSFSNSDSGLVFTAGLRKEVTPDLEVHGKAAFDTAGENDFQFGGGAVYQVTDELHAEAQLIFADADRLSFGVRYYMQ